MELFNALLVEDDPDVAPVIKCILEDRFGFKVEHFVEAKLVIEQSNSLSENLKLAILDLMMPGGVSGFDLCQFLRERYPGDTLRIIVITGYDSIENRRKAMLSGATDYLAKPFDIDEFVLKINKFITK